MILGVRPTSQPMCRLETAIQKPVKRRGSTESLNRAGNPPALRETGSIIVCEPERPTTVQRIPQAISCKKHHWSSGTHPGIVRAVTDGYQTAFLGIQNLLCQHKIRSDNFSGRGDGEREGQEGDGGCKQESEASLCPCIKPLERSGDSNVELGRWRMRRLGKGCPFAEEDAWFSKLRHDRA